MYVINLHPLLSSSMFHSSRNVLYPFRVQSSFSNHSHRRGRPFLSCCRAAWTRQLVVSSGGWSSCPWKNMGYKIGNIREYHWDIHKIFSGMKFESVWNLGWFALACISVFRRKHSVFSRAVLWEKKWLNHEKPLDFARYPRIIPRSSEKWRLPRQPRRGGYPSDHLIQMAAWQRSVKWSFGMGRAVRC